MNTNMTFQEYQRERERRNNPQQERVSSQGTNRRVRQLPVIAPPRRPIRNVVRPPRRRNQPRAGADLERLGLPTLAERIGQMSIPPVRIIGNESEETWEQIAEPEEEESHHNARRDSRFDDSALRKQIKETILTTARSRAQLKQGQYERNEMSAKLERLLQKDFRDNQSKERLERIYDDFEKPKTYPDRTTN